MRLLNQGNTERVLDTRLEAIVIAPQTAAAVTPARMIFQMILKCQRDSEVC